MHLLIEIANIYKISSYRITYLKSNQYQTKHPRAEEKKSKKACVIPKTCIYQFVTSSNTKCFV